MESILLMEDVEVLRLRDSPRDLNLLNLQVENLDPDWRTTIPGLEMD